MNSSTIASPRLPYRPGLDGLRALAVLGVFFFHLQFSWALGGYLGVETFFVISGYLITSLLLEDYRLNGQIDLKRFWLRRIRRLWPALWLLLAGVVVLAYALSTPSLARLREDVPAAVAYVTNWLYIWQHIPYFERYASPPLLQHLWSLAIEEQFYVLWPLMLWGSVKMWKIRKGGFPSRGWAAFPLVLALLSSGWMLHLIRATGNTARVYYGTDTRAAGFLLGSVLAIFWPLVNPKMVGRSGRVLIAVGGSVGLVGLLWIYARLHEFTAWLYPAGFLLTDVFTALLIISAVYPEGLWPRFWGQPLLRWIGKRSYAIYLWHWPLISLYRPGAECRWPITVCAVGHLALTMLLAEWSYRVVENPIRKRGFRAWWQEQRQGAWRLVGFPLLLLIVAGFIVWRPWATVPAAAESLPTATPRAALSAGVATSVAVSAGGGNAAQPTSLLPHPTPSAIPSVTVLPTVIASPTATAIPSPTPRWSCFVTLIGDSVMARTYSTWMAASDRFFHFYVDARPNRQPQDIVALLPSLRQSGHLYHTVVLHIGTNALPSVGLLNDLVAQLARLGVHKVYLVTIRRPVGWEGLANEHIAQVAKDWPQLVVVVDWHAASEGHPEWFLDDGVHLNQAGAQAYVNTTLEAIRHNGCAP